MESKVADFNPQGPRGPRLSPSVPPWTHGDISIHKALAGLDITRQGRDLYLCYFNPQGPRGPRRKIIYRLHKYQDFNPQGPRGPRLSGIV